MCDYSKEKAPLFRDRKSGAFPRDSEISIQLWLGGSILESKKGTEGHAHIVMRGSGEVDLIAGLKTQTNRPEMSFQTREVSARAFRLLLGPSRLDAGFL